MIQVMECLPSKCKALSSNSSTTREREREREQSTTWEIANTNISKTFMHPHVNQLLNAK
jgi:hypothetical protein